MVEALSGTWTRWVPGYGLLPRVCDRPGCKGPRAARLWRKRSAVRMEGSWFCSSQCVEREVEPVFDRILSQPEHPGPSHHRLPLGLLMLSRGLVGENQLRTALSAQHAAQRGKIGQWLQGLGFVTERQVVTALALQWACPVLAFPAETERHDMVPSPILRSRRMMPVRFAASTRVLYVAFSTQVDHTVLYALEHMLDCQASPCVVSDATMDGWLRRTETPGKSTAHLFERMTDPVEMARITGSYIARLSAEEVRVVKCRPYVWVRLRSSRRVTDLLFATAADQNSQTFLDSFSRNSSLIAG